MPITGTCDVPGPPQDGVPVGVEVVVLQKLFLPANVLSAAETATAPDPPFPLGKNQPAISN